MNAEREAAEMRTEMAEMRAEMASVAAEMASGESISKILQRQDVHFIE